MRFLFFIFLFLMLYACGTDAMYHEPGGNDMAVKPISLVSNKLIDITNGSNIMQAVFDGSIYDYVSDGTPRTLKGWFEYMDVVEIDLAAYQMTFSYSTNFEGITMVSQALADASGYLYDEWNPVTVGTYQCVANTSGTHRFTIQGSPNTNANGVTRYSRITQPTRATGKINSNVWESTDYLVLGYNKKLDVKRWIIDVRWMSHYRESDWIEFIDLCGCGRIVDTVELHGDEFWIFKTETYRLSTETYTGMEVDLAIDNLLKFTFTLIEVK